MAASATPQDALLVLLVPLAAFLHGCGSETQTQSRNCCSHEDWFHNVIDVHKVDDDDGQHVASPPSFIELECQDGAFIGKNYHAIGTGREFRLEETYNNAIECNLQRKKILSWMEKMHTALGFDMLGEPFCNGTKVEYSGARVTDYTPVSVLLWIQKFGDYDPVHGKVGDFEACKKALSKASAALKCGEVPESRDKTGTYISPKDQWSEFHANEAKDKAKNDALLQLADERPSSVAVFRSPVKLAPVPGSLRPREREGAAAAPAAASPAHMKSAGWRVVEASHHGQLVNSNLRIEVS